MREKFAYLRLKFAAYVLPFLLLSPAVAGAGELLPSGWRMPTKFELSDEWRAADINRFALVREDFNGDGQLDKAMLLVAENSKLFGVFVFLSQTDGSLKKYRIVTSNDINFFSNMGIAKVVAGKYSTACGKGYWNCKKNELPEIVLSHQSINYFKIESASSYFYWDAGKNGFRRTWISD